MKGDKKILVAAILVLLLAVCFGTYAIYRATGNATGSIKAAAWSVKVKDTDIASTNYTFDASNITWTKLTGYNNTIAPGSEGYIEIPVDATGSEVDVKFEAALGDTTLPAGMTATLADDSTTEIAYGDTMTGNLTAPAFYASSDERLKENIENVSYSKVANAASLSIKSFNFKADETKKTVIGVIAQEVEKANLGFAVVTGEDGMKAVDYTSICLLKIAYLEEKIKELDSIIKELKRQNIPLVIDPTMVRGLDYYTNFVFEINSNEKGLAGQPTLLGGGRYNNLVGRFASEDVGCIGFACGIERILVQLELEGISLPEVDKVQVVIANLDESCNGTVINIMNDLRKNDISVVCNFNTYKIRNHFNVADRLNCEQVIILGKKELENKKVLIKNQKTLKQEEVKISEIVNFLKGK